MRLFLILTVLAGKAADRPEATEPAAPAQEPAQSPASAPWEPEPDGSLQPEHGPSNEPAAEQAPAATGPVQTNEDEDKSPDDLGPMTSDGRLHTLAGGVLGALLAVGASGLFCVALCTGTAVAVGAWSSFFSGTGASAASGGDAAVQSAVRGTLLGALLGLPIGGVGFFFGTVLLTPLVVTLAGFANARRGSAWTFPVLLALLATGASMTAPGLGAMVVAVVVSVALIFLALGFLGLAIATGGAELGLLVLFLGAAGVLVPVAVLAAGLLAGQGAAVGALLGVSHFFGEPLD